MLNETAITFAALEQVANAAGLDLALAKTTHTKGASKSTPPRFGDQSPHTIAYAAIGPMFRELASTFTDAKIPAKGLSEGEALFSTYFQSELQPGRGQPSLFRRCCEALSIKDDDAPWIFSVVIVSLLRGVVTKYTEHLVDVNDDSTDFESSDEEDVSRDERIARENFGMIGSMAAAFEKASPTNTTQVKSDRSDQGNVKDAELKALIRNGRWQSHYSASQQVWEDVALALTLRRGEDVTSRWIENALKQTAEQRRGVRLRALAKLRKNRDGLETTLNGSAGDAVHDGIYERIQIEFGALLVEAVVSLLGKAKEPALIMLDGSSKRDVRRIAPSIALLRKLAAIDQKASVRLADPTGPLLAKPKPWRMEDAGLASGGMHLRRLEFYKFRSKNTRVREFLQRMNHLPVAYERVFPAVNALQDTGWRINQRVWNVMRALIKASDDGDVLATGWGESFTDVALPTAMKSKWQSWLEQHFFARHTPKQQGGDGGRRARFKDYSAPGWRVISPMGVGEIERLSRASEFYFAHNVDSRGRIYPMGSYLHPQGEDAFRGLLEFREAKAVTKGGVSWLALHGSQCASRTKILAELGIKDRSSPTIQERLDWISCMTPQIIACAEDPLDQTWWRDVGGRSAFQFLAFCFAWSDYRRTGFTTQSRLPVHADGTCNGLQHIAALTGDAALAASVNLTPGEPRDIYLEVADAVFARASDASRSIAPSANGRQRMAFEQALAKHEPALRVALKLHSNLIGRDAAKKVVMVIPYGAGIASYAEGLAAVIRDYSANDPAFSVALDRAGVDAMAEVDAYWASRLRKTSRAIGEHSEGLVSIMEDAPSDEDQAWRPAFFGRQVLATLLAREFALLINERYPTIEKFKNYLQNIAGQFATHGVPVAWVTPTGFPVLQNGFSTEVEAIDIRGLGRIRMSHFTMTDEVSPLKQLKGILPNFIHSLDSSHLVGTVNRCKEQKVTSFSMIHDSFGTHAADMPDMQACLREAFVDIYSVDRLKEFSDFSREVLSAMEQAAELSFQESDETPLTAAEDLFQLLTRWAADVRAEERSVAPPPQETNGVDIDAESDPVIVKPKRGRPKGAATGAKAKKKSAVELPDFQRVDKDFDVKLVRDADYFFF